MTTIKNKEKSLKALCKAIEIAGTPSELAFRIGVKPSYVFNWLRRNKCVPARWAVPISEAVNYKVSCHELCPEVFPKEL